MNATTLLLGAAAMALAACASIPPARMALPPALTTGVETFSVVGIGGGRSGAFQAGAYSGTFTRSASRLAFFDPLYERRDGRTNFTLRGPQIDGALDVSCRMRQRSVTIRIVSFDPHPMAYACDVSQNGRALPARFEIQAQRRGLGGAMLREERRGEIMFGQGSFSIRSVHDLEGSPMQMATPIGYVVERDGIAIGAVEINGAPQILMRTDVSAEDRTALAVAAMALGLFWDPAESALGREAG